MVFEEGVLTGALEVGWVGDRKLGIKGTDHLANAADPWVRRPEIGW